MTSPDLKGQRIGWLEVVARVGTRGGSPLFHCECHRCGGFAKVTANSLRRGTTRSCGCLLRENRRVWGLRLGLKNGFLT